MVYVCKCKRCSGQEDWAGGSMCIFCSLVFISGDVMVSPYSPYIYI